MKSLYLVLLFIISTISLNAQNLMVDEDFFQTDGYVHKLKIHNDTLYVAGNFSKVGKRFESYGYTVDTLSGEIKNNILSPDDYITDALPDGNGGWYIAGNFTMVGNVNRVRLAHIDGNGGVNALNVNFGNNIQRIIKHGNILYVCGHFSSINGQPHGSLASIDLNTGQLTSWNPNISSIRDMLIHNGILYVITSNNLTSYDLATGNETPLNAQINGTKKRVIEHNNSIYIGGSYGIKEYDIAGDSLTPFFLHNIDVESMCRKGDTLIFGGTFTHIGSTGNPWTLRTNLAAIDLNTSTILPWNPAPNDVVRALNVNDNKLYVGGFFTSINNINRSYTARFDTDNLQYINDNWYPNLNSSPRVFQFQDDDIYIGGYHQYMGGKNRKNFLAIDLNTNLLCDLSFNVNDEIHDFVIKDSLLMFCGDFTQVNNIARNRLAFFNRYTETLSNINPSIFGTNNKMELYEDTLYVTMQVNPTKIKAIDIRTGQETIFPQQIYGSIKTLERQGNTLYFGGHFNNIYLSDGTGFPNSHIAAIDCPTQTMTAWNPTPMGVIININKIIPVGNNIYVGGDFNGFSGNLYSGMVILDSVTGNSSRTWTNNIGSLVADIHYLNSDTLYYMGGIIGGANYLNPTTGVHNSWNQSIYATRSFLARNSNEIYLGGTFTSANNTPVKYLARLTTPKSISITSSSNTVCTGDTINLQIQMTGGFLPNQSFTIELSDLNGNFQNPTILHSYSGGFNGNLNLILPQNSLNSSNYLIRVKSQSTTLTSNLLPIDISNYVASVNLINSDTIVCSGTGALFTALATNGGNNPNYDFWINGNLEQSGGNSQFFLDSVTQYSNVFCTMTSSLACVTNPNVTTDTIDIATSEIIIDSINGTLDVDTIQTYVYSIDTTLFIGTNYTIQWNTTCGNIISGNGTGTVTIQWADTIGCDLTVIVGNTACSDSLNIAINPILNNTNNLFLESNLFSVMPNPTSGLLTMNVLETGQLYIFDMTGQQLETKVIRKQDNFSLNIEHLPNGMLIFMFRSNDGKQDVHRILKN